METSRRVMVSTDLCMYVCLCDEVVSRYLCQCTYVHMYDYDVVLCVCMHYVYILIHVVLYIYVCMYV